MLSSKEKGEGLASLAHACALGAANVTDGETIDSVVETQQRTKATLERATLRLAAANAVTSRAEASLSGAGLARTAALCKEMRSDLDYIHRHTRAIRKKIIDKYPELAVELEAEMPKGGGEEEGG